VTGAIDHLLWYEPINGFLFAYNDQPNGESTLHRVLDAPSLPSAASKAAYRDPYGDQNPTMMYQNILDLSAAGNTLVVVRNFNVLLRSSTDLMTHSPQVFSTRSALLKPPPRTAFILATIKRGFR
jgi:hypothetical protein